LQELEQITLTKTTVRVEERGGRWEYRAAMFPPPTTNLARGTQTHGGSG